MLCYANVMQKFSHSLSRHQILKAIVKYKTHPSIIFKSFHLHFSSFYFSQVDKKIVFLKTSKFHKVVQESDPHVRILKENVDYFAEYTRFEIYEAITLRIRLFCKEKCSQKFHKIYKKASMPECFFK